VLAVVERHVLEGGKIEVRTQLAVQHMQRVAVELRRDALRVVVGRFERARVEGPSHPEDQAPVRAKDRRHRAQEPRAATGRQVADRAAEEGDDPSAVGRRQRAEISFEVAEHGVDGKSG
jgi:hypothetical protein